MDISGLTSVYSDYIQSQTRNHELEKLKADWTENSKGSDDQELMKACKQFEAYFLEQMFKEMQKTVPKTEYSSQATGNMVDYYRDNLIQEIAAMSTESQSMGLAQTLYEQLKRNTTV